MSVNDIIECLVYCKNNGNCSSVNYLMFMNFGEKFNCQLNNVNAEGNYLQYLVRRQGNTYFELEKVSCSRLILIIYLYVDFL